MDPISPAPDSADPVPGPRVFPSMAKLRPWIYVHGQEAPPDEALREHSQLVGSNIHVQFPMCRDCGQPLIPVARWKRGIVERCPHASAPLDVMDADARVTVGRNDPCPCGSGRKYKKCCGAN